MRRTDKTRFMGSAMLLLMVVSLLILGHQGLAMAAGATLEKTKLAIGLPSRAASFFPNHVADQKGFFKEEGITEVKIIEFRGDAPTVQALAAGTVDLNVASLHGLVNTINAGQKFRGFWAGYNMTFFEWYGLPKHKSIAETKGGRYGVSRFGSLTDSLTRYVLRKAGLDPERDVNILQIPGGSAKLGALESGQLDVGILALPFNFIAAEKGFVKLVSQREHIANDYPSHIVYAKEKFIAENPNTIKAYLRATSKAMEWIKANRDEAAKLMNKRLKFKLEYCGPTIDYIEDGWHSDGSLPQEGMKVFWEITISIGDAKEPWPNDKWLDDSFLKTQDQWRR